MEDVFSGRAATKKKKVGLVSGWDKACEGPNCVRCVLSTATYIISSSRLSIQHSGEQALHFPQPSNMPKSAPCMCKESPTAEALRTKDQIGERVYEIMEPDCVVLDAEWI